MDSRVRARVHARRKLAALGYGRLFDALTESLYSHDPLNLGPGGLARNEYGSPVATIIPRLESCSSPEQLRFVVEAEMRMHYPTADITGTDWAKLAEKWWKLWSELGPCNE